MSKAGGENYGIQASNVHGVAMAAGPRATAVVNQTAPGSRADLETMIGALRSQIEQLQLGPDHRKEVEEQLSQVESLADPKPHTTSGTTRVLKGLLDALKMAGVAVETLADLHQPLAQIAAWFHLPPLL
jgi:hypothetical protein